MGNTEKQQDKMVYISPLTDYGFKRLFGTENHKEFLISFLNTLMPDYQQIEDLEYADSFQNDRNQDERAVIFDLHCKGKDGEVFIIEMQRSVQRNIMNRLVYYSTYPVREMSEKGPWNYGLLPIYSIGILNFILKPSSDKIVLHHSIRDNEYDVSVENLNYITVELPKFKKGNPDDLENDFERWLYVLRYIAWLDDRPAALQERIWKKFFENAKIARLAPQDRKYYEHSLKVFRDNFSVMEFAEERGFLKGVEKAEADFSATKQKLEVEKQQAEAEKQAAFEREQQAEAEKQQAELKLKAFQLFYGQQKSKAEIATILKVSIDWLDKALP